MENAFPLVGYSRWRTVRLCHWARYAVLKLDRTGPAFLRVPDVLDTVADRAPARGGAAA